VPAFPINARSFWLDAWSQCTGAWGSGATNFEVDDLKERTEQSTERRLTRWKRSRGGRMSVVFPFLNFPQESLRMDLGATNSRVRQRLHSFCDRILRGHQHLRSTYLSLRASPLPPNVDGARAIQTIRPSPARVVHGLPILRESAVATVKHGDRIMNVAWPSCRTFITVDIPGKIGIMDGVTVGRLHTFTRHWTKIRWLSFSPDSRSLTSFGHNTLITHPHILWMERSLRLHPEIRNAPQSQPFPLTASSPKHMFSPCLGGGVRCGLNLDS